jgi:hypothetical protein
MKRKGGRRKGDRTIYLLQGTTATGKGIVILVTVCRDGVKAW